MSDNLLQRLLAARTMAQTVKRAFTPGQDPNAPPQAAPPQQGPVAMDPAAQAQQQAPPPDPAQQQQAAPQQQAPAGPPPDQMGQLMANMDQIAQVLEQFKQRFDAMEAAVQKQQQEVAKLVQDLTLLQRLIDEESKRTPELLGAGQQQAFAMLKSMQEMQHADAAAQQQAQNPQMVQPQAAATPAQ